MRYTQRQKLERSLFSPTELAAMKTATRNGWIGLLRKHLINNMAGSRILKDDLLNFDGLIVVVRTKAKAFYGNQFYVGDTDRLIVTKRSPSKTFKPRWDVITRIEFKYTRPPATR